MILTDFDLAIAARTVYGEARGETDVGKRAVAWVIRNRMTRRAQSSANVCLDPKQFLCWNDTDVNRSKIAALREQDPDYLACVTVASGVLAQEPPLWTDPTNNADAYLITALVKSGAVPDWWKNVRVTVAIGSHTFGWLP
jgi:N-acetylmuramoyl-L-alanine amidase